MTGARPRVSAAVLAVGLLLLGCAPTVDGSAPADDATPAEDVPASVAALPRARVTVGDGAGALVVDAFVAGTAESRARGLQGVTALPEGTGMLFLFDGPSGVGGRPGFWMLDTLVPLDIAFAADGVVVGVATMTPCPGPPCPITHPGVDYDVALEVGAGVLTGAGVGVGDAFVWEDVVTG